MSPLQGKFVWCEHQSSEPAPASRFYEKLFGWQTENMPVGDQQYPLVLNGRRRHWWLP